MTRGYSFELLTPGHIPTVTTLINSGFGVTRSESYVAWKLLQNPLEQIVTAVMLFNNKAVGVLGAVPAQFMVRGREHTGIMEVDFFIDEKHRRLDNYLQLVNVYLKQARALNCGFTFGVQNENTVMINSCFAGKTIVSTLPFHVRIINGSVLSKRLTQNQLVERGFSSLLNVGLKLFNWQNVSVPQGMRLSPVKTGDERFDTFWEKIKNDYPIMKKRDSAYLQWRYSLLAGIYEAACLEDAATKEITGYVIYGIVKEGAVAAGRIYECNALKSNGAAVTRTLLQHAVQSLIDRKADIIYCWAYRHMETYAQLKKLYFISRRKRKSNHTFSVAALAGGGLNLNMIDNEKEWFLSMGDMDID